MIERKGFEWNLYMWIIKNYHTLSLCDMNTKHNLWHAGALCEILKILLHVKKIYYWYNVGM